MKSMTCKQLGGACDELFSANSFAELAQMSKEHCVEKIKSGDNPHIEAMQSMQDLMTKPGAVEIWMKDKEREFNEL